jgi:hypothetical protein
LTSNYIFYHRVNYNISPQKILDPNDGMNIPVIVLSDGQVASAGTGTFKIRIWSMTTYSCTKTLSGHTGPIQR